MSRCGKTSLIKGSKGTLSGRSVAINKSCLKKMDKDFWNKKKDANDTLSGFPKNHKKKKATKAIQSKYSQDPKSSHS